MSREDEKKQTGNRRIALMLATQLPDNVEDARTVLRELGRLAEYSASGYLGGIAPSEVAISTDNDPALPK